MTSAFVIHSNHDGGEQARAQVQEPPRASLMGLPGELRRKIFTYALQYDRPLKLGRGWSIHKPSEDESACPSLFLSCSKIYDEARPCIIEGNTVYCEIVAGETQEEFTEPDTYSNEIWILVADTGSNLCYSRPREDYLWQRSRSFYLKVVSENFQLGQTKVLVSKTVDILNTALSEPEISVMIEYVDCRGRCGACNSPRKYCDCSPRGWDPTISSSDEIASTLEPLIHLRGA